MTRYKVKHTMLVRNFITTSTSIFIQMILSFAANAAMARLLGAESLGIYILAILVPQTIYSLLSLGIATAHTVYAGKEPEKRGTIAFQSFSFAIIVGLLVFGFYEYLLTGRPGWFERFEVVGPFNLILASFIVFLQLLWVNLRGGVVGANRISILNIDTVGGALWRVLLIAILVWTLGLGVTGGILVQLFCFGSSVIFMVIATAVKVPISSWRPDFGFFKKSLSLGIKVHLNNIAFFAVQTVDRYMIGYLIPNSDKSLGHYALAAQFAQALWLLPQTLQVIFLPHLSVTKADKAILTARTFRTLFIVLLPVLLLSAICSWLIPIIVGPDYKESVLPFLLFIPGVFLLGATRSMDSFLTYKEKPMYGAVNSWIGAFVNITLNLYLIPRAGINGAATASSLSIILMALITIGCFIFETKLSLRHVLPRWSDFIEVLNILRLLWCKIRPASMG